MSSTKDLFAGGMKAVAGMAPATSSGNWTVPISGVYEIHLQGPGAGGGSGGAYTGGSAGALVVVRKYFTAGTVIPYVVGAGGSGAAAGAGAGSAGGYTAFENFLAMGASAVLGGVIATTGTANLSGGPSGFNGGAGGNPSGGVPTSGMPPGWNATGWPGYSAVNGKSVGSGGDSPYGRGGEPGLAGQGYGSGGGFHATLAGGSGAPGAVFVFGPL